MEIRKRHHTGVCGGTGCCGGGVGSGGGGVGASPVLLEKTRSPGKRKKRKSLTALSPLLLIKKWSDDERGFMCDAMNEGASWTDCVRKLNTQYQSNRSVKACKLLYSRINKSVTLKDASVQTDWSLGVRDYCTLNTPVTEETLEDIKYVDDAESRDACSDITSQGLQTVERDGCTIDDSNMSGVHTKFVTLTIAEEQPLEHGDGSVFASVDSMSADQIDALDSLPVESQARPSDPGDGSVLEFPLCTSGDGVDSMSATQINAIDSQQVATLQARPLDPSSISQQQQVDDHGSSDHSLPQPADHLYAKIKQSKRQSILDKILLNQKLTVKVLNKGLPTEENQDFTVGELISQYNSRPELLKNRKIGKLSVLMKKDFDSLKTIEMKDIIEEFDENFPELLQLILSIMLPKSKRNNEKALANILPRWGLVYSVIIQARIPQLSRLQRAVAMCLADNICDQKVYDRLNRIGVSSPYCVTINVIKEAGSQYSKLLTERLKEGKQIRLIGDNLNFTVGVKEETSSHHRHMQHRFTSTALISEHMYLSKPTTPQIDIRDISMDHLLITDIEFAELKTDICSIVADILSSFLPQLSFLKAVFPTLAKPDEYCQTEIVPLPCLPFNENKYQDDVKILEWYQSLLTKILDNSNQDKATKFVIGGDQLTRERLSEALLLRLNNEDPEDRFNNIGRCVFEFFHLGMNYLKTAIFDRLWNENGKIEVGTMRRECERIFRKNIDPNVSNSYEDDKRFVVGFVEAYVVEAAMEFFNLENLDSSLDVSIESSEDKQEWGKERLMQFVEEFIFPIWTHGRRIDIPIIQPKTAMLRPKLPDKKKDYGHFVLEVGMTFIYFLKLVKQPSREKFLLILKMIMLQLRGSNEKSKYAREISRMLYSVMGIREAFQVFQACFVSSSGLPDQNVPADLVQEWNVKTSKAHIKHMFANKTDNNITYRTAALPGINQIGENLDLQLGTMKRAKKHKQKNDQSDILTVMNDLRRIRPFNHTEQRKYDAFSKIKMSPTEDVDMEKFKEWFKLKKWFTADNLGLASGRPDKGFSTPSGTSSVGTGSTPDLGPSGSALGVPEICH
ncbi:hypothetical protein MAR_013948 [Mya arenaria]|uniref:DUF6589 domain-containing protein n=1 Tax=Mya arenaria TaxID=6604 RepID=A0ABY7G3Z4_MYAAR|nr:hypothetical protein MAR_013948 [Mya arenaria]